MHFTTLHRPNWPCRAQVQIPKSNHYYALVPYFWYLKEENETNNLLCKNFVSFLVSATPSILNLFFSKSYWVNILVTHRWGKSFQEGRKMGWQIVKETVWKGFQPFIYVSTSFLSSFRKPKMERRGEREKLLFTRKKRKNTRSVCLGMACNKKKRGGGSGRRRKNDRMLFSFLFFKRRSRKNSPVCINIVLPSSPTPFGDLRSFGKKGEK